MAQNGASKGGGDTPDPLLLTPQMHDATLAPKTRARPPRKPQRDGALGFRLFLVLLVFAVLFAGLSLKVKPLSLPVLAVAEVEVRLNRISAPVFPGTRVALGGIELMLDEDWSPVFRLQDMALMQGDGSSTILDLPAASMTLDAGALVSGRLQPRQLTISGAHLDLRRDLEGRINLAFGRGTSPAIQSLAEVFDRLDLALALPELAQLQSVEFEALSLSLYDERLRRTWELGDGRLVADNRPTELAAELAISFLGGVNARARMTAVSAKGTGTARIRAEVSDIPASELAAQHPVLAWLSVVDAPISGQLSLQLQRGGIDMLEGELSLGAGALQPSPDASAIAFSKAGLKLSYDPEDGRLRLSDLDVR